MDEDEKRAIMSCQRIVERPATRRQIKTRLFKLLWEMDRPIVIPELPVISHLLPRRSVYGVWPAPQASSTGQGCHRCSCAACQDGRCYDCAVPH